MQPRIPLSTVPKEMKAAVLVEPGRFEIECVPLPEPKAREVRVRIESCGVCASNVPVFEGRPWFKYPMQAGALGHEAVGIIDALGPRAGKRWQPGQRVALLGQNGYAEYETLETSALVALPDGLMNHAIPAEPVACAINIFKRSGVRKGKSVAIVGLGFLGSLLAQLAIASGATVITLSRRSTALEMGRKLGALSLSLECNDVAVEEVRQATGGRLCDVVIEATGREAPLKLASEIAGERGRLVIAGYHQDGERQVNMQLWNWRGLDVINAHERDPAVYKKGMQQGLRLLDEGSLSLEGLITHTLPLEELNQALQLTRDRPEGFMKAMIRL